MKFTFKKLRVPASNETKEVDAVQLWEVRWTSRYGRFCDETQKEVEAFASKELASEYAQSLTDAFALVRHTSQTQVTVKKTV